MALSSAMQAALYYNRKRRAARAALYPTLSAFEVAEATTGTMATISSAAPSPNPIVYTITGGADAANFSISGTDLDVDVGFVFATQQSAELIITATSGNFLISRTFNIGITE